MLSKMQYLQKAQKWLDESGAEYTLRDIKTDNPTAELHGWADCQADYGDPRLLRRCLSVGSSPTQPDQEEVLGVSPATIETYA